jgi:hypothetical protein
MPPKTTLPSTASQLNSLLLAILIGVASFIAAQVWLMNGRLVSVEVKLETVQNGQNMLSADVGKIKDSQARNRSF